MSEWTFQQTPKPVGWWIFPGSSGGTNIKLGAYKQPSWLHIKMMDLLLGFGWEQL